MIRRLALVAALLLSGCDVGTPPDAYSGMEPWEAAPAKYVCTAPQIARAQAESRWCADNTTFFSSYCYGTAIMRNCSKPVAQAKAGAR